MLITHFLMLISEHSSLQGKMQFCDRLSQLSTGKMLLRDAVRFIFKQLTLQMIPKGCIFVVSEIINCLNCKNDYSTSL